MPERVYIGTEPRKVPVYDEDGLHFVEVEAGDVLNLDDRNAERISKNPLFVPPEDV